MKSMWEKYHDGDYISDGEIKEMIKQCRDALEYLQARGDRFYLAKYVTLQDLDVLYKIARVRALNGW